MGTPIWPIEGVALDSTGELVADSLGAVVTGIDTDVTSALAEIIEVEHHFHGREFWWGSDGSPGEDTAIAATVSVPFVAVSGDNTWGTAISIMGTDDVPAKATDTRFDAHRILVMDTEHTTAYRMRFIWGSGTSGDAITAGQWSEFMFVTAVAGPFSTGTPVNLMMPRATVGEKLWAQVWNATDTSEVDFYYGVHGYLV